MTTINIQAILTDLSKKRPIFHSEADFQHALAWAIQETYPDSSIRLEKNLNHNTVDILVNYHQEIHAIIVHYKTKKLACTVDEEDFYLTEHGEQMAGRYDVLKDLERLERLVEEGSADQGVLIFLTNDKAYSTNFVGQRITNDYDFRLHEGKEIRGQLTWKETAITGREAPITLNEKYQITWHPYSTIDGSFQGEFHYLILAVERDHKALSVEEPVVSDRDELVGTLVVDRELEVVHTPMTEEPQESSIAGPHWFTAFCNKGIIPSSPYDFRDKLASVLRAIGYSVEVNKWLDRERVAVFATKETETLAIELHYSTAHLRTVHNGSHIFLYDQRDQKSSRYDYVKNVGKIEKLVNNHPGMKGYAIFLTNDSIFWSPSEEENPVDEAFHIHEGAILTGRRSWSEEATLGTKLGREKDVVLENTYSMNWQPYIVVDENKNNEFRVLINEVV